jgi:hypothetical protein
VTKEFLEGFYVTAARFYRAAPWRMVGGDRLMKLTFPEEPATSWGVSVIGQLGQTLGLSLMRDIEAARAFIEQDEDPRAIETLDTISVQFGEAFDMLPRDLWNLERNHWEVAGDEGYPLVVKMEAGGRPVCPSHEELMMTQAVMRSLPSFLDRPGHGAIPIQDASGRTMRLGWEIR